MTDKLNIVGGGRYQSVSLSGHNKYDEIYFKNNQVFNIFVPRMALSLAFDNELKFRTGFAQGFRVPQTFDEDLHTEIIGGSTRFINLNSNLKPEFSDNFTFSVDKTFREESYQINIIADLFYTNVKNSFILSNPELNNDGVVTISKRNGSGSKYYGSNLELNLAYKYLIRFQAGLTIQDAIYNKSETLWISSDSSYNTSTKQVLRTPNLYAYSNLTIFLNDKITFDISNIYTGKMVAPHIVNIHNNFTIINRTNDFFQITAKVTYLIEFENNDLEVSFGCKNITNSYQNDLDYGKFKDAAYVYGPTLPRTLFFGLNFKN